MSFILKPRSTAALAICIVEVAFPGLIPVFSSISLTEMFFPKKEK